MSCASAKGVRVDQILKAVLEAAVGSPVVKSFLEETAIKIVAEVFHRRSIDPQYLADSDSAFRQWGTATTEEEKDAALANLVGLLNRPR